MEDNVVLNTTAYSYEFLGLVFKPKSARAVTSEQKTSLMSIKQFAELVAMKKFDFSAAIPDNFKTETQRLNEALARIVELEEEKKAIIAYVQDLQKQSSPGGAGLGRLGTVTEGAFAFFGGLLGLIIVAVWIGAKAK